MELKWNKQIIIIIILIIKKNPYENIVHIRLQKLLFLCDAFLKKKQKNLLYNEKHNEKFITWKKYVLYTCFFWKLPVFIYNYINKIIENTSYISNFY